MEKNNKNYELLNLSLENQILTKATAFYLEF